jgi:AcrR family transcriptional regulator
VTPKPAAPRAILTEELGRRERKKRDTRRRLQRAALDLVSERGLSRVNTEEIAEAADVSSRTFFNYFASKEEALSGDDPDRAERLRRALVGRPAGEGPLASLRAIMLDLAAELADRRDEWRQRMSLVHVEPQLLAASFASWSRVESALARGVAERAGLDVERDPYPALLVAATVSAMRTCLLRWGRSDQSVPLPEMVAEAIDLLAAGLPPPTAQPTARPTAQTTAHPTAQPTAQPTPRNVQTAATTRRADTPKRRRRAEHG